MGSGGRLASGLVNWVENGLHEQEMHVGNEEIA
jgi:hypothetical protein